VVFFFMVAVLGFADASFLTIEHLRNVIPPCTTSGCETVLTSPYSSIFGIPVGMLGAFYYLAVMIGAVIYLESKHVSKNVKPHHLGILKWTLVATAVGFSFSLWFLYLQAFVIGAFCQYCLVSAFICTTLFVTSIVILMKDSRAGGAILQ